MRKTLLVLSILLSTLFYFSAKAQEFILNPGMGGTAWVNNGCSLGPENSNSETSYGGGNSSNIVAEIDAGSCQKQIVCIVPNIAYNFNLKISRRTSSGCTPPSGGGIKMRIVGVQSGTVYFNNIYTPTNTTFALAAIPTLTFTPGATDKQLSVEFSANANTTNCGIIIDDASLTPVNPIVLTPTTVCQNASNVLSFSNLPSSGLTYSWNSGSTGSPGSSTLASPTFSWAGSGAKTVTTAINNGTCNVNFSNTVNVNTAPVVTVTNQSICNNTAFTSTPTSNLSGTVYSWTSSVLTSPTGGSLAGFSNQTSNVSAPISQTLTNSGTTNGVVRYVITPTSSAGCTGTSTNLDVTVKPTPTASSAPTASICTATAFSQAFTSNVVGTTYTATASLISGTASGFSNITTGISGPLQQTLTNNSTTDAVVRYTVTPSANGCAGTPFSFDVTVSPKPTASATASTICNGETFSKTPTTSVPSTQYTWTAAIITAPTGGTITGFSNQTTGVSGPISQTLTNTGTTAGVVRYTVTPTFSNCTGANFTFNVTVQPTIVSNSTSSAILCNGGTSTITTTVTSGVGAYTYSLNGGTYQSGTTFAGKTPGTYTITVKGANNCLDTNIITISQPDSLTLTTNVTGNCTDGTVSITANSTGGTGAKTYKLNGGVAQSSNTFNSLGLATYTIQVTDANGCSKTTTVTASASSFAACLDTDGDGIPNVCDIDDDNDGILDVVENDACVITSGNVRVGYIPNARDLYPDNGYTFDGGFMTPGSVPKLLNTANFGPTGTVKATFTLVPITANPITKSALDALNLNSIFLGGIDNWTAGTSYLANSEFDAIKDWSDDADSKIVIATQLQTLPWGLTISNSNVNSDVPSGAGSQTTIFKGPFGTVTSFNQGGGYQGAFTSYPNECGSSVLAKDAAGKPVIFLDSKYKDIFLGDVDILTSLGGITNGNAITSNNDKLFANLWAYVAKAALCGTADTDGDGFVNSLDLDSDNDGCSDAYESGVTTSTLANYSVPSPYGQNGFADSKETSSESGVYNGNYTYSNATNSAIKTCCSITTVPAVTSTSAVICSGSTFNLSSLAVTSSAPSGSHLVWSSHNPPTSITDTLTTAQLTAVTTAGKYYALYTNGTCFSAADSISLSTPSAIVPSIASFTNISCNGGNNGSITVSATGGNTPYTYSWSPSGGTTSTASGLAVGTYTCTISDANSCSKTISKTITQPNPITFNYVLGASTSCDSNGYATLSIIDGGTPGYTYLWSHGKGTNYNATNLAPNTNYTVVATDINGCTGSFSVNVTSNTPLSYTSLTKTTVQCATDSSIITVAGTGNSPRFYKLDGGTQKTEGSPTTFKAIPGTHTITMIGGDGCEKDTTFTITYNDVTNPVVTCPSNVSTTTASGVCSKVVNAINLTATDNCAVSKVTWSTSGATTLNSASTGINNASGSTFNKGTTAVTYIATDVNGNSSTCSFNVVVSDNELPSIVCPSNKTVAANASCEKTVLGIAPISFNDNCSVSSVAYSVSGVTTSTGANDASGLTFNKGTSTVTYTVTDASSNTNTCSFNVVVNDSTKPTISCLPTQTLNLNVSCSVTMPDYTTQATVTDNCTPSSSIVVTQTPLAGSVLSGAGTVAVKLIATDQAGNKDSCTFNVIKENVNPPILNCISAQNLYLSVNCSATLPDYTSLLSYSDVCNGTNGISITQSPAGGTVVSGVGSMTVTFSAYDSTTHLTSTCSATINKIDTIGPSITCPSTTNLYLNNLCSATLPNYTSSAIATDGCTASNLITFTQSPAIGTSVSSAGNINVTLIATDASGNNSSCSFVVAKMDTIKPTISCPATVTANTNAGSCTATISSLGIPTTNDNCGVASVSNNHSSTTFNAGTTAVIWTVTDVNGNTQTCSQNVIVTDNTAPIISSCATAQTVYPTSSCMASMPNFTTGVTATDNCTSSGSLVKTQTPLAGTMIAVGTTNVTITVTDASGNSATCTTTLTVTDTTSNVTNAGSTQNITCANPSAVLGSAAHAGFTYSWSPSTNLSNSTIAQPTANPSVNTVYTVTVTGTNGCSATSTVSVNVNNSIPTANAGANINLNCTTTSAIIGTTAVSGNTYSWSPASGLSSTSIAQPTASPTVTTIYTVTATGTNGCSATSTVTVNVNTTLPTANAGTTQNLNCTNTSATFGTTAVSGNTYSWSPATGLSSTSIAQPIASPTTTTTYTVIVTGSNGCTSSSSVLVNVNTTTPFADAGFTQTLDCNTSSVNIGSSAIVGNTYSWSPSTGLNSSSIAEPIASPSVSTTYTVTVTGANGCTSTAEVLVDINTTSPTISFVASDASICVGSQTTLTASGAASYNIMPGNLANNAIENPTANTTYTVTATGTNGCTTTSTVSVSVKNPTSSTTNTSVCINNLPFNWNGTNYYTSGNYTYSTTNAVGCDSVATLNLTVNSTSTSITTQTVCASNLPYNWNGTNYSTAGIYTYTTTNAVGCDSVATLDLTINICSTPDSLTVTPSCPSCPTTACVIADDLSTGGQTFTSCGTPAGYTQTLNPTTGCLTLTPNVGTTTGATTCVVAFKNGIYDTTYVTINAPVPLPCTKPNVTVYPNNQICYGQNVQLKAVATNGGTLNWTLPAGFTGTIDNSISGESTITINNFSAADNGIYSINENSSLCNVDSAITIHAGAKAEINTVTTACVAGNGELVVNTTPSTGVEYSVNGGAFQNSNVLTANAGSTFVVGVRTIGTSCVNYYTGNCVHCASSSACTNPPKDSLVAPKISCVGNPISMNGYFTNATNITWSTSGTGTLSATNCTTSGCAVNYTPSAADLANGNVIITITSNDPDGAGPCVASVSSKNIILINGLVAPTVSSNSPVCANDTIKLNALGAIGTINWTATAFSETGTPINIANATSAMSGSYTATASANGCANVSNATNVNVLSAPSLVVNVSKTDELCLGGANGSILVNVAGGSGNYTICYNGNLSNCVTNDTANFQWIAPGTYNVTVVDNACPNNTFTYPVTIQSGTVVPTPIISDITICEGENLILNGTTTFPTSTIIWTKGAGFNVTGNPITIQNATPSLSGIYFAKEINANGCASAQIPVNITVVAKPSIDHVQVNCNGTSADINITATLVGATLEYSLDGSTYQSSNLFNNAASGNTTVYVRAIGSNCATTLGITVPNCACPNEPIINISAPGASCGLTPIPATAGFTNVANATWSTSGTGTFSTTTGASPLASIYTPSALDLATGFVHLTLTTDDPDASGPCNAVHTSAKILLVNSLDVPTITATQSSYCEGDTVLVFGTSNAPVSWTGVGGYLSSNGHVFIPNATPSVSGLYFASVSGNGCVTQTAAYNLVVNAAPTLAVTTSSLPEGCEGQGNGSIHVNVTGGTGNYNVCYTTFGNCANNTTSPIDFKWLSPNTYTVSVSDVSCANAKQTTTVVVNPGFHVDSALTASSNSPVCEGEDLVLTATGNSTGTFLWTDIVNNYTDTGLVITRTNAKVGMSGQYKVQQLVNGCASVPIYTTAKVYGTPTILSIDTLCTALAGGEDSGRITVNAIVNGNDAMEFALNDGGFQSSNIFNNLSNGLYTLKARPIGSDCEMMMRDIELYCSCNCNKDAIINVFPNPNNGSFTVNAILQTETSDITISVYDLGGRVVYEKQLESKAGQLKHDINIKTYATGAYMLKMKIDGEVFVRPIMVNR